MGDLPFEVRVLPISAIRPAPYNPRVLLEPDSVAYQKLETSLQQFGLVEPLIWNELSGQLVGGHARLQILQNHGVTEVPVSVVRLTPEREKALNIVLNNPEAQGRYDSVQLDRLLTELSDLPELPLTGFDLGTLRQLTLEPVTLHVPEDVTAESPMNQMVMVQLEMTVETLDVVRPVLDELLAQHPIRSHLKQAS